MSIRRQVSVSEATHRKLRALAFVTGIEFDALLAKALELQLKADKALAERVAHAEAAVAT